MKFEMYRDAIGEWRWRLVAKNGRKVAVSGEGYRRKGTMRKTIDSIICSIICSINFEQVKVVEKRWGS